MPKQRPKRNPSRVPEKRYGTVYAYYGFIYDFLTVAAGAWTGEKLFFTTPKGGTKTQSDTNLGLASQLPAGVTFEAQYLKFCVNGYDPAVGIGFDIAQILTKRAYVEMKVSNKVVLEAPLCAIQTTFGLMVPQQSQAVAADGFWPTNTLGWANQFGFPLKTPKRFSSNEQFELRVFWDDSITVTTTGCKIGAIITGLWNRPA